MYILTKEIFLMKMLDEKHPDTAIDEIRSKIDKIQIKNLIKEAVGSKKIQNVNLKLYAFVYDSFIDFPASSDITFDTITTNNFFKNVHKMIKVKVHLRHSLVTGEISGYAHDFCNWRIRQNKSKISMIKRNLFGFDMLFFLKGYWATVWCTKEIKCRGSNLTNINFANISGEVKFIDTLKYYQRSLAESSVTLSDEEKKFCKAIDKTIFKFSPLFS